jgi:hypothetical protein
VTDGNAFSGPDGEAPVVTSGSCAICESHGGSWMHSLDWDASHFRVYGKGHVWASDIAMCDRCEQLCLAGDDEALVALRPRTWETTETDVDEHLRNAVTALRRADLGSVPMSDWLPLGASEHIAEGFVPIEELTGAEYVAREWPEAHRRAVPETRPGWADVDDDGDGMCWLVRSPWPTIPTHEALGLMWDWVSSQHPPRTGGITAFDQEREKSLMHEFLHRDEAWVIATRQRGENSAGSGGEDDGSG